MSARWEARGTSAASAVSPPAVGSTGRRKGYRQASTGPVSFLCNLGMLYDVHQLRYRTLMVLCPSPLASQPPPCHSIGMSLNRHAPGCGECESPSRLTGIKDGDCCTAVFCLLRGLQGLLIFEGLTTCCVECGQVSSAMVFCPTCSMVQYCSDVCRQSAWERCHLNSCGRRVPTPASIRAAPLLQVAPKLTEFGAGDAEFAATCMLRISQACEHALSTADRAWNLAALLLQNNAVAAVLRSKMSLDFARRLACRTLVDMLLIAHTAGLDDEQKRQFLESDVDPFANGCRLAELVQEAMRSDSTDTVVAGITLLEVSVVLRFTSTRSAAPALVAAMQQRADCESVQSRATCVLGNLVKCSPARVMLKVRSLCPLLCDREAFLTFSPLSAPGGRDGLHRQRHESRTCSTVRLAKPRCARHICGAWQHCPSRCWRRESHHSSHDASTG